VGPADELN